MVFDSKLLKCSATISSYKILDLVKLRQYLVITGPWIVESLYLIKIIIHYKQRGNNYEKIKSTDFNYKFKFDSQ